MESLDNAGVYKITDELAIIQTLDFFTPIVDDPYMFGQIAVANALSDVYTMGGRPLTAMNIVCFPVGSLDISVLKDILRGGIDKMIEAKVTLVGGHSIDDTELKYGLSVTGTVHPKRLVTNSGAKAGDKLILTKPLGTGIINTAAKAGMVDEKTVAKVTECMATLNDKASELMQEVGIHACTDITGFGLIGHTVQLAQNSQVGINIDIASIPFFPEAGDFAKQGLCPAGLYRNREFYSPHVTITSEVPTHIQDILFDPQTSGGLLICLAPEKSERLLNKLRQAGIEDAAIIGEAVSQPKGMVIAK
jgi:selenide,water dikinase